MLSEVVSMIRRLCGLMVWFLLLEERVLMVGDLQDVARRACGYAVSVAMIH